MVLDKQAKIEVMKHLFMTKELSKALITRSKLKNKYTK